MRCGRRLEGAIKAADVILHGGGFGVVALDLCETGHSDLNRIPLSYWYRFRNALENTPTRMVVLCHVPLVKACAPLHLATKREATKREVIERGGMRVDVFTGIASAVEIRKQRAALAG